MRQPSQIRRCREVSGVYMRNRNLSSFEYFNTAVAIRCEVTGGSLVRDVLRAVRRMRAAWALAQSLLLLDLKTGEVYER